MLPWQCAGFRNHHSLLGVLQRVPHVSNLGGARIGSSTWSIIPTTQSIEGHPPALELSIPIRGPPSHIGPPIKPFRADHPGTFHIVIVLENPLYLPILPTLLPSKPDRRMSNLRYHRSRGAPYTTRAHSGMNNQASFPLFFFFPKIRLFGSTIF